MQRFTVKIEKNWILTVRHLGIYGPSGKKEHFIRVSVLNFRLFFRKMNFNPYLVFSKPLKMEKTKFKRFARGGTHGSLWKIVLPPVGREPAQV